MPLVLPHVGYTAYDPEVEKTHAADLKLWLDYMEHWLEGRTWFVDAKDERSNEGPSLADLSVGQSMRMVLPYWLDLETRSGYGNVMAWWERLVEVPEVKEAFGDYKLLEKRPVLKVKE
jgi:elongation factor 1-gamma